MTSRTARVARMFGIDRSTQAVDERATINRVDLESILPRPGQLVLLTGPSGSGKSSLLRAVRARTKNRDDRPRWIDLHAVAPPGDAMVIDCLKRMPLEHALAMLSRVGLAEVWTYLRRVDQLSDGQQWRLKLARAMAIATRRNRAIIVCDEFAAILDRVTATIVARCLRRLIDADYQIRSDEAACAIVATSHDDLIAALAPDVVAECDFDCVGFTHRQTVQGAHPRSSRESRR